MEPRPKIQLLIDDAKRSLKRARTVEECRRARELAVAARSYAESAESGLEVLQQTACLTIKAEHALGLALAKAGLTRGAPGNQYSGKKLVRSSHSTGPKSLRDLGISKFVSSRAQLLAKLPSDELRRWLVDQCEQGKAPTFAAAERHAKVVMKKPARVSRRVDPASASSPKGRPSGSSAQLIEHLKMLDNLLREYYDGGHITRTKGRYAKQLIAECLHDLRRLVRISSPDQSTSD